MHLETYSVTLESNIFESVYFTMPEMQTHGTPLFELLANKYGLTNFKIAICIIISQMLFNCYYR